MNIIKKTILANLMLSLTCYFSQNHLLGNPDDSLFSMLDYHQSKIVIRLLTETDNFEKAIKTFEVMGYHPMAIFNIIKYVKINNYCQMQKALQKCKELIENAMQSDEEIEIYKKNKYFDDAADFSIKAFFNEYENVKKNGLKLFKTIIKGGYCHKKAADFAIENINNENLSIREKSLLLLTSIVKQENLNETLLPKYHDFFEKAQNAAILNLEEETDRIIQKRAQALFGALFQKGLVSSINAEHIATQALKNNPDALIFLTRIIPQETKNKDFPQEYKNFYQKTKEVALLNIEDERDEVRAIGSLLFRGVFQKDLISPTEAEEFAHKVLSDDLNETFFVAEDIKFCFQDFGEALFKDLIKKNESKKAVEFIKKNWKDCDLYLSASTILNYLIEEGFEYDFAIDIANKMILEEHNDDLTDLCFFGLESWVLLIKKTKRYRESMDTFNIAAERSSNAKMIFEALFEEGQGYAEAKKFAYNHIQSDHFYPCFNALEIFKLFVERGMEYKAAIHAAIKKINDIDEGMTYKGRSENRTHEISDAKKIWGVIIDIYSALYTRIMETQKDNEEISLAMPQMFYFLEKIITSKAFKKYQFYYSRNIHESIKRDSPLKTMVNLIKKGIQSKNNEIVISAINFLTALVMCNNLQAWDEKFIYHQAREIFDDKIDSQDVAIHRALFNLIDSLSKKEQAWLPEEFIETKKFNNKKTRTPEEIRRDALGKREAFDA